MEDETRNASSSVNVKDRITRLPEALIHHILSFVDTKCAVQTCVLSKQWIDMWKSLQFLKFDSSLFSEDKTKQFIDFIYMVFMFRNDDTDIQKFSVDWETNNFDDTVLTTVNKWCLDAAKCNAQEITMAVKELNSSEYHSTYDISYDLLNCKSLRKLEITMVIQRLNNSISRKRSRYEIFHGLFNCESLRKLELRTSNKGGYTSIILPTSINLPQLEELILDGVSISGAGLCRSLIPGCPLLETLMMVHCKIEIYTICHRLVFDSPRLTKFEFDCWDRYHHKIKLGTPNLEFFTCRSCISRNGYFLEVSFPVSNVYFDMYLGDNEDEDEEDENPEIYETLPSDEKKEYAERMLDFLEAVCTAKTVKLSPGFLEALSQVPDLSELPRLCNLKSLTLGMWSTRGCLRAIAYLLEISPNLTSLHLESNESNSVNVVDDWEAGLLLPGLSHLKAVQIEKMEGSDAELEILGFLLKNAKVLEGVAIYFRDNVDSPGRVIFMKKLREVPTASSSVKLVFN